MEALIKSAKIFASIYPFWGALTDGAGNQFPGNRMDGMRNEEEQLRELRTPMYENGMDGMRRQM